MHKNFHCMLAGGLLSLTVMTTPVFAEDIPNFTMEQIIVESSVISADDPLNISDVNTKIVKPGKATNIADLLKDVAGVDVTQRTLAGDTQDTVRLRGFESQRFSVLLNGRPVNSTGILGGSYMDWGTIPLEVVEKIEIIKGPKSAKYGNTLGGVINIITRKGTEKSSTHVQTDFGSYGYKSYRFDHSGSDGSFNYFITAGTKEADGYLRNNYLDSKDYSLRLGYTFDTKGELTVGVSKVETERGFIVKNDGKTVGMAQTIAIDPDYPIADGDIMMPGPGGTAAKAWSDGSYWKKTNTYYDLAYTQPFKTGKWKISYYKNNEKREEWDPQGSPAVHRLLKPDQSYSWAGEVEQRLNARHKISYGYQEKTLQYGWQEYYSTPTETHPDPSQKLKTTGVYIEDNWSFNPKVLLNLGLRYDRYELNRDIDTIGAFARKPNLTGNSLSPKLNLSYKVNDDTSTYFSIDRFYRVPTSREFWWNYYNSGTVVGNIPNGEPNKVLKPEKGYSYEIGIKTKQGDRANYKANLFYNDINDYIVYDNSAIAKSYANPPYNLNKAKVWGVELETEQKLMPNLVFFANYTYQKSDKSGNYKYSPWESQTDSIYYMPEHKANIGLRYKAKAGSEITLGGKYVGKQNVLSGNFVGPNMLALNKATLPSYFVTNLRIIHPINHNQEISFYVDNIFDKKYEEAKGYPMPGTTYGIGYKISF
ncbi:Colicin I receptor precursor [Sporomusa ovata DSM 2662]|uniref:Outer membrane vitamin B12 receptor BtuB n=1 Tax=Sporomusa ovata TaxID=2378 RepID=A0A0U1KUL9_9FIRM|nr:TonB-dependent receptor [Sporomusa ovata]EQB26735.1 TonB-dependent receptor [Sporomusa ovata DSM 2662]CQR70829.1 Outer membrane vitamin B12 receptor BtuB [Sporomusa ovata]